MWNVPNADASSSEDRLRRAYEVLADLFAESPGGAGENDPAGYQPPPPPAVAFGANVSATDLLGLWFRPPSAKRNRWDAYFGDLTAEVPVSRVVREKESKAAATTSSHSQTVSKAILQAVLPETDHLEDEDAEDAVDVLYAFVHAFGRGDIEGALQWVSDDYHVIEGDQEIDKNGLRCRLESLLDSLHGYEIEVSFAEPPESLSHPYGMILYAEIQIDGFKAADCALRSHVEHRLVLFEKTRDSGWRIAALSKAEV
jgi:hypothetical protein